MEAAVFRELARMAEILCDDRRHNRLHPLVSVVSIAVLAVLSNCDSWAAVARFAEMEQRWLSLFLPLPHGVPSRQTFERVFARLQPEEMEKCLGQWFARMHQWGKGALKQVALDGKALRHSYQHVWDQSGMAYLVSAFASENGLVLAQREAAGKGQELGAIRQLLTLLDLEGCVVSIDALGCQKDIAQSVREAGGDYCLAVKENQPGLFEKLRVLLDEGMLEGFAGWDAQGEQSTNGGHGRIETRTVWVTTEVEHLGKTLLKQWPGLRALAVVESRRMGLGQEPKTDRSRRYYILSRAFSAQEVQQLVRGHWGIENGLHHILDVSYGEDACRVRTGSATNLSRLRRLTLNMLKTEKGVADSVAGKRQRCALSREYRLQVVAASLQIPTVA